MQELCRWNSGYRNAFLTISLHILLQLTGCITGYIHPGIGSLQIIVELFFAIFRFDTRFLQGRTFMIQLAPGSEEHRIKIKVKFFLFVLSMLALLASGKAIHWALKWNCIPSSSRRCSSKAEISGNSFSSTLSPRLTTCTFEPRRWNACPSSMPTGPPPTTSRRSRRIFRLKWIYW
jgi:hypothetical protein